MTEADTVRPWFSIEWHVEHGEYIAVSHDYPGLSGCDENAVKALRYLLEAVQMADSVRIEDGASIQFSLSVRAKSPPTP